MKLRIAALALLAAAGLAHASPVIEDRVAAVVNGEPITAFEIEDEAARLRAAAPGQVAKMQPTELRRMILDRLIEEKIRAQEAAAQNVTVTEAEVDKLIEEIRRDQGITQEELLETLDREGLSYADYRKRLEDQIQAQKFLARSFKRETKVTAEQVEEYYDQHADGYMDPPRVRIAGILLLVAPGAPESEESAVRARAEAIREQLRAGASFEALAAEHSQGPRPREGGLLGDIKETELAPEFASALAGVPEGGVAGPVRVGAGYFILKRVKDFPPEQIPLDRIHARVERDAYQAEMAEAFEEWMEKLKTKAKIEILE